MGVSSPRARSAPRTAIASGVSEPGKVVGALVGTGLIGIDTSVGFNALLGSSTVIVLTQIADGRQLLAISSGLSDAKSANDPFASFTRRFVCKQRRVS